MKRAALIIGIMAISSGAFAFDLPDFSNTKNAFKKDYRTKNAEYLYGIQKQEEKDRFEKQKMDRTPSGFMTVEEYEMLSAPIDKTKVESQIPKVENPSGMKYIPHPEYKIVRYNNPPGSPELSVNKRIYTTRQLNAQGITSPDYSMMVYPAIYYYPESAGVACDLFVVPLEGSGTPLSKMMKANIMHRNPEPILSTDKSINIGYTFRTLTPVDFSFDSTKLLVKEKIGSSNDGIWQTNAIVYDFETKTSYNLTELRAAIVYYWKEYKGVDLEDKRWDIYPIGFDIKSPYRVIAAAYAYTGEKPVFLGTWSIDSKGEQTRLISFENSNVNVSMNGLKLVKGGVVPTAVLKAEELQEKQFEKSEAKIKKQEEKDELKKMSEEHKAKLKELREEFNSEKKEFKYQDKINGSTSQNDAYEKYKDDKFLRDLKQEEKDDKKLLKELNKEEKQMDKEIKNLEKQAEKALKDANSHKDD